MIIQKIKSDGGNNKFPVIGIGASAGGLAAFEKFFNGMPIDKDPDMAFVLVQHLAPDHKSILTDIIKRYTKMEVFEVEDGMLVRPNCAYIIPPNRNMALINGALQLFEITALRGQNMPIDFFFRSLAEDKHEEAICIILSGSGSDGNLGLRAIKKQGGLVICQSPETADYDGMPKSAISTGLVDLQIPPSDMVNGIISYLLQAHTISNKSETPLLSKEKNAYSKVCFILRTQTGHDFSRYKSSTINRRIERRMALNQIKTIEEYLVYLQETPSEVKALFQELLIGVTTFFRDKDAFKKLEKEIIPEIFRHKTSGSNIRVWSVGCATGEEAYSIAILLKEKSDELNKRYNIQVFATDIDNEAIRIARKGIYPSSIADDITPKRLKKCFTRETTTNYYRINENIRAMLIFSGQSVIKDPCFSKIDIISCRNLLIYLTNDLQEEIIPLFHYALNPKGILFLGSAETIGDYNTLFTVIDSKQKIYQRKENYYSENKSTIKQAFPALTRKEGDNKAMGRKVDSKPRNEFREIVEKAILKESSLAGILVNDQGDILYLHGRTGMYLELSQGESSTNNVLKMAREGLKRELKTAFVKVKVKKEPLRLYDVSVKTNGHFTKVDLFIKEISARHHLTEDIIIYIILLKETKIREIIETVESQKNFLDANTAVNVEDLKTELRLKEEYLDSANEELEKYNEELKYANEEMQSVNEELQSTNEELETSKEELQSINEELSTVNSELQDKVHDLSQINNDMNNLIAGTNIATIFLDNQNNVLRYTPKANEIVNLIASDMGRPIEDIALKLVGYSNISIDVESVLENLIPKEIEVQGSGGKWYNMVIQPYRTGKNVIEGTVINFVDITDAKIAKELLSISEMSYRTLFETAKEGIIVLDGNTGRIIRVNPFMVNLLGFSDKEFFEKEIWNIGFLKDMIESKSNFIEIQKNKYLRYSNLPLKTNKGEKISVEFICNAYEIGKHKMVQCNIRVISKN